MKEIKRKVKEDEDKSKRIIKINKKNVKRKSKEKG